MGQLADALKVLIDKPDDLSTLPSLIGKIEELETSEASHIERIAELQAISRSYLAQIPIPGKEVKVEKKEEAPSMADVTKHIIETITGGN